MNIVIIPARGGSKGIPGKNIKLLAGKPLIAWSIETALNARLINKVIVSTDSEEIAKVSIKYGAEVVKRPDELATDDATSESVIIHCLRQYQDKDIEFVIFRQCTSPLIFSEDIDSAINLAKEKGYDSAFSAYEEHFMGRWQYKTGKIIPINYNPCHRPMRQDYPAEYIENGAMYVFKPEVIERGTRFGEKVGVYLMPKERSFQIDTIDEFNFIESIFTNYIKKYSFANINLGNIKLVILDFDGVMTDNTVIIDQEGRESVKCNRSDGIGVRMMKDAGLEVICITSETNNVVKARCNKLRIEVISSLEKDETLKKILSKKGVSPEQCIFLGNDVNDIPILRMVKYPVVVNNAHINAKKVAEIILAKKGGEGAVLELAQGLLNFCNY